MRTRVRPIADRDSVWALAGFQCPYPPRSSRIRPHFVGRPGSSRAPTFGGVERETATLRLLGRRASHARGRRFETRRAHGANPRYAGGSALSGKICREQRRPVEAPLEAWPCAGEVASDAQAVWHATSESTPLMSTRSTTSMRWS